CTILRLLKTKKSTMKKTLAILTLALFIGGISVPAIAASNNALTIISLQDEDPKKKEKSEKKAETSKEATKSGDCSSEKKSSDCSSKCEGEK
ncbi:MAG: hypothetical protein DRJ13_06605, partial [Bacteroidetes bacterium]